MPLNHDAGESIDGLGVGAVVELKKWSDTAFFDLACDRGQSKAKGA